MITDRVKATPKRVVFAEGEEEAVIRAAIAFRSSGMGTPVLVGREERIYETMDRIGLSRLEDLEIHNASKSEDGPEYGEALYRRMQRNGMLRRDCQRMVNNDRNVFAASMVMAGRADAMVTGVTRNYAVAFDDVCRVIDRVEDDRVIGLSIVLARGRTVFVADTNIHEMPTATELAGIAEQAAKVARRMGYEPRVAFLAYSTFGQPQGERSTRVREAVDILGSRNVDFEYDGEMAVDVALDKDARHLYPFCRLSGPANVLIMPAIHSASIGTKLLQTLGGCTVLGPFLVGLSKPVQIAPLGGNASDLTTMAAMAAFDACTQSGHK